MPEALRYLREDIVTGLLSDIELNAVGYEKVINRPGGLTARVPLRSSFATEDVLDPWRTALYLLSGENVIAGGILLPPSLDVGGAELSIQCFGWPGYFDRRIIRGVGVAGTVGFAEPGASWTAKPLDDATVTGVFGAPLGSTGWVNVGGGYSRLVGVAPLSGHAGIYRSHFSVPTTGLTLHPIQSVTIGEIVSGVAAPIIVNSHLHIGGADYLGAQAVVNPGAVVDLSATFTTNPATGLAWTAADVYAFNTGGNTAGFATTTATTLVDCVVNQLWMVVTYGAGYNDYFVNTDQFQIVAQLVMDAQSQTKFGQGYDLGIGVTWDALSGVMRNKQAAYTPWLAKNLGDALRDLAAQDNGFDYEWQYTLDPTSDRIHKAIKLFYPMMGRDTGFLFEYEPTLEGNVISRGFADPVSFAWTGDGWGAGNDATRLRSPYVDSTLRTIYPPYDAAPTWSDEQTQSELDAKTRARFQQTNRPRRAHLLRVNPDLDPKWNDYGLGDLIGLRIDDGYASVGNQGTPAKYRVTGMKVDVDANHYDVTMSDPATLTPRRWIVTDRYAPQPTDENAQLAERLRRMEERLSALEGAPLVGTNLTSKDLNGNALVVAGVLPDGKHGFLVQNANGRVLFRVAAEDGQTAPFVNAVSNISVATLITGGATGFRPGFTNAQTVGAGLGPLSVWNHDFWTVGPKIDYNNTIWANGGTVNWYINIRELGGTDTTVASGTETTNITRAGTFTIPAACLVPGTGTDPAGRHMRMDFLIQRAAGTGTGDMSINQAPRNYGP